jgi:hypothetical protein
LFSDTSHWAMIEHAKAVAAGLPLSLRLSLSLSIVNRQRMMLRFTRRSGHSRQGPSPLPALPAWLTHAAASEAATGNGTHEPVARQLVIPFRGGTAPRPP